MPNQGKQGFTSITLTPFLIMNKVAQFTPVHVSTRQYHDVNHPKMSTRLSEYRYNILLIIIGYLTMSEH